MKNHKKDISIAIILCKSLALGSFITILGVIILGGITCLYAFIKETTIEFPFKVLSIIGGKIEDITGIQVFVGNNFFVFISVIICFISVLIFTMKCIQYKNKKYINSNACGENDE